MPCNLLAVAVKCCRGNSVTAEDPRLLDTLHRGMCHSIGLDGRKHIQASTGRTAVHPTQRKVLHLIGALQKHRSKSFHCADCRQICEFKQMRI